MLPIDLPSRADLEALLVARDPASVSIYVTTTPISTEVDVSRIEMRNLATGALNQLRAAAADKRAVAALEDAFGDLLEDEAFWARQARSLAVFATPTGLRTFRLPSRLSSVAEVADRFHVKPLLRAVTFPQAAFVLALATGSVRLLEISPDLPVAEVPVADLPQDAASAVGKASLGDRSPSGRIQGSEGQKVRLAQYARQVDQAIRPILAGSDLPLILAATAPLDAIYRSVSTYPRLAAETIGGSPEGVSDTDLAAAAREVIDSVNAAELTGLRERHERRAAEGRAATDLVDIARAATFGAVEAVFVDIDEVVPGQVDEETGSVTFGAADDTVDYGVVDEIARRVLLTGGRVLAVRRADIPGGGPAAATLRFAI